MWRGIYETVLVSTVSVRLSVPAWAHNSKPAVAGLLLCAQWAADIDRLLQQRPVNAGSAMLSAYVGC